eukprot:Protomagalhaensia_sp_Gyna_25__5026@NODE_559_length_3124_cov_119_624311_g434_i0_p1_GENE_NODE_559_length_3124_cov_119_624311_g434_i0NODE_559_length_3124_cov_119_624311_g434_i0_p1_ORF_typecomplete_len298_score63_50SNARE/PF05739_19/6_1e09Syntaxin/PF00804_25/2_5e03Syntaxin/PF00804_25/8_3e07Syntaxin/PF00804_25/21DUF349/PF03993_12/92DUF349/PF03993_12/7_7_NODE_559_length_3124_cov_119_624311_g434_i08651758
MSNVVVNQTAEFRHARDEIRRRQEIFKVSTTEHNNYQSIPPPGIDVELATFTDLQPTERAPTWLMDIEAAHCALDTLKNELGAFQRLQSQHLMNVFSKNMKTAVQEIVSKSNDVGTCIKNTEARIMKLRACHAGTDPVERTIRLNASRCVAKSFEELSNVFRKKQNYYVEELNKRELIPSTKPPPTSTSTNNQQEQMLVEAEAVRTVTQVDQLFDTMQEVERLFDQTRSLAIEQGSMLDRIDVNVEEAVDNTERGRVILRKIEDRQRHGFAKRISVALFIVDVILLILLIIKWWPRS